MTRVSMSTIIKAPAKEVWQVVSNFNGAPAFITAIAQSSVEGAGVGAIRRLVLKDGGAPIVERLEKFNEKARTLSYAILASPLPLADYVATMQIKDLGHGQCELKWYSAFKPKDASEPEAIAVVEDIYTMGFNGLKKLFEG
jgi:hypothetical protein